MKSFNNFIAGGATPSSSGATTEIINPSTGKAYATAQLSNAADVDQALKAAANAFEEWRETTPAERQRALLKIADALESRADEIVAIESENTGKPIAQVEKDSDRDYYMTADEAKKYGIIDEIVLKSKSVK